MNKFVFKIPNKRQYMNSNASVKNNSSVNSDCADSSGKKKCTEIRDETTTSPEASTSMEPEICVGLFNVSDFTPLIFNEPYQPTILPCLTTRRWQQFLFQKVTEERQHLVQDINIVGCVNQDEPGMSHFGNIVNMEEKGPKSKHLKVDHTSDSADDDDVPRFTVKAMANLPFLPDDVLHCIMKYLGPVELKNLSRITERLGLLATDKNLWKKIDFRPHKLTCEELWEYLYYFKKTTKFLALKGFVSEAPDPRWREEVLTSQFLQEICLKCPDMETLILDEHFALAYKLGFELFPASLRHLSMTGCILADLDPHRSYFQNLHVSLPFLKVLVLSNCSWVSPHDFMSISKCYHLEELRMDGCPQLVDCVAYTSLAARFGFHGLKILDLRNTRMGDSDVGSFNRSRNLTHLYLQCPTSDSYIPDSLCSNPTCMDLSCRDDFMDSSDDDDIDAPSFNVATNGRRVWIPSPILVMNTLPLAMPPCIPTRRLRKSRLIMSQFFIESRSEPHVGAPSTSCCPNQRQSTGGDENGDPNLPQASTSRGTLNIVYNPAGPSAFRAARKLEFSRKHLSGDSDSSSDENFLSSISLTPTRSEVRERIWMLDDSYVPTSQVSCNFNNVPDNGSRGAKRRHSSGDRSPSPKNFEPGTSARSCVSSRSGDSFRMRDLVHVGSSSNMPGCSLNESTSNLEDATSVHPKLKVISGSSSTSAEEVNGSRQESDMSKLPDSKTNENERERSSMPNLVSCGHHTRPRHRRMTRRCRHNSPHIFHRHNHEPINESTISDLCIMSFVLNDSETDGAGYVRIMSPQMVSTRPQLHTLVVKNYVTITDASLNYLSKLNSLRYLDVSGTSVTEVGVLQFKLKRPDVEVVSDHDVLSI